jgi:hypothetical protein
MTTDAVLAVREPPTFSLRPTSLTEAMEFAKLIARSNLVPKDYRGHPEDVLIAIQMGLELGLSPLQALQNIALINGKPSLFGDALLAVCQAAPDFVDIEESCEGTVATCTVRRGNRSEVTRTFSQADAERAHLWGKAGPWKEYPQRMLQMRARGFALRDAFADRLRGIIGAEEAMDLPKVRVTRRARAVTPASPDEPTKTDTTPDPPTDAPPPAPEPVQTPLPTAAPKTVERTAGARILATEYVTRTGMKPHWVITTSRGVFVTRDPAIAKDCEVCEETNHAFVLTWKPGTTAKGEAVKNVIAMALDDEMED